MNVKDRQENSSGPPQV
uniref:Uncharacterized protein n=1 Tax=Anguilla anguilla TaxID=7936 RepID=A0A0E9Q619_ANGAN